MAGKGLAQCLETIFGASSVVILYCLFCLHNRFVDNPKLSCVRNLDADIIAVTVEDTLLESERMQLNGLIEDMRLKTANASVEELEVLEACELCCQLK